MENMISYLREIHISNKIKNEHLNSQIDDFNG